MKINHKLLRFSRLVHIYLSVFLLLILLFFSITGIFLNHSNWFQGQSKETVNVVHFQGKLAGVELIEALTPELKFFLDKEANIDLEHAQVEVDQDWLYIESQYPGRSVSVEMDVFTGKTEIITTRRGVVATLNELHKGRHAKQLWLWLIDLSAVLVVLFSLSGLLILLPQKRRIGKVVIYSLLGLPLFIYAALA